MLKMEEHILELSKNQAAFNPMLSPTDEKMGKLDIINLLIN